MTRFFRTVFATSLTCLLLQLIVIAATGVQMPFSAFSCLLSGLLLYLLPHAVQKLENQKTLFAVLGAAAALLGFLPILLTRCPALHVILYGISVVIAAILLAALRHNTTHNNFKARFGFITFILICIVVYFILSSSMLRNMPNAVQKKPLLSTERVKEALNGIIPYAIVLLSSGVLCLRGLRAQYNAADDRSFQKRQLRDALIFVASVSTVFISVPFLKSLWTYLLNNAVAPIARLLAQLIEAAVASLLKPGDSPMFAGAAAAPEGAVPVPTAAPDLTPLETAPPGGTMTIDNPPAALKSDAVLRAVIALLILAAAVTIACIILVKALNRLKKSERSYPNEICEELPKTDQPQKEEKLTKHSADPRRRMRYLYAEFLRDLRRASFRRHGGVPQASDKETAPSDVWGEASRSGYQWMRAGMTSVPEHSSSYSAIQLRDEAIYRDNAANVMKLFDRRSRSGKRRLFGKPDAELRRIFRTNTCEEIRDSAKDLSRADASDLAAFTAYYERARYQLKKDPADEDAARMAELFGRIKKAD